MPSAVPVDWESLDQLVLAVPVHVLYFDDALVCRYAAPDGPHFLGHPPPDLLGVPAAAVFPPELALTPRLEQVRQTHTPWHAAQVAYPAGPGGAWPAGHWDIHLRPWTLLREQHAGHGGAALVQRAPPTPEEGVLVSCLSCQDGTLEYEATQTAVLLERIRTQLTVIRGFASVLRRRQAARGDSDPAVPHIELAAITLTDLIAQYEDRSTMALRHPDQR